MSWSLSIVGGDLSFAGNQMATVSGATKLIQDLSCDILEPMGTDDAHPTFGSLIEGGTQPDGTFSPGIIGNLNNTNAASFVNAELTRISQDYQARQASRNAADVATYGKSTLTADEALLGLDNVSFQAAGTTMLVAATLQTGAGSQPLVLPVSD
jgi:hypothetical protein